MTSHYIHPMLYTCDSTGCSAEAEATSARLPNGWTERVTVRGGIQVTAHLCPRCTPPEETKS